MSSNRRVIDASEIGGETGVSGSDIERQIEQRRTIVGLEDNLAASAQLEGQADVRDPRRLDPGQNETVAYIPGQGVQVVSEGSAPTADRPTNGQEPGQQQPQPPDRQSGSGIGPGGVEGSEEAVPPEERDAPDNDSTEGIAADQTGRVEEGQGIDIPEVVDEQDAISATEIGGETGVSGSDIEEAVASGRPITDIEDAPAVAAQLERQFDIKDPRQIREGGGQVLVPGEGLVVQPSEDQIQERAEEVEQELVGEQITDISTDLVATGAEFREEDIQVSQTQDGSLRAELSPVGQERVENIAERQQEEAAERQIEQQLNTAFTDEGVSIDDSGEVVVSENVRQEVIEQRIAEENPGVSEDDVGFQNGEPVVQQPEQPAQPEQPESGGEQPSVPDAPDPAEQLEERTGLEQGEDFTINDGRVNVTDRGAQELQAQQEQEQGDIFSGGVASFEGVSGIDVPGDGSLVGEGREDAANADDDRFGDDLTGIDDTLAGAGRFVDDEIISPLADTTGDVFALGQQGSQIAGAGNPVALALGTAGAQQSADALDDTETRVGDLARGDAGQRSDSVQLERFGEGTARGAGAIANIPALAATGVDATEFTVEAGEQTVEGDGGEFAQEATEAGALRAGQGAEFASSNPTQFTGQVLGGALASTAAFGAGRAVAGARGAKAAGVAIQPGEEALRTALRGARAARRATPETPDIPGPNVDVQIGRNVASSGRTELNVNADIRRRIDDSTPSGQSTVDAVQQSLNTVRDLPDRARTAARNANFNADAATTAARQRVGDTAGSVRETVGDTAGTVTDAPGALRDRAVQGARNAEATAAANVADAADRLDTARRQGRLKARRARRDAGTPTLPRGLVTDSESSLGLGLPRPDVSNPLEGITDAPAVLQDRATRGVRNAAVSVEANAAAAVDRLNTLRRQGRLKARRARRDVGSLTLPRGFVTDSDSSLGFGLPRPDMNNPLEGISELGIRVDVGKPGRRIVDADNLETEGQTGVEFRGDFDDASGDTDFQSGEQPELFEVDADDTGSGQLQLRRTDSESERALATESEREGQQPDPPGRDSLLDPSRRFEGDIAGVVDDAQSSAVEDVFSDSGFGSATDTELNIGTGTGLELGQEFRSETRTEFGQEFRSELGTETRTEVGTETRTDQRQELGTETRTEIGQEFRTETRAERRQELGTELGFDTETRTETDVGLNDVFDDDERAPVDFGAADDVFSTGVVQSLDDLDSGSGGDPLDGFDRLL